jgi:hypothetical protein
MLTSPTDPGGGGCLWEIGADPKTAKCTSLNPTNGNYRGFAQPPQSPAYIDQAHMDRTVVKFGPIIKYLFDPTKPRWEERVRAGEQPPSSAAPAPKAAKGKANYVADHYNEWEGISGST